MVESSSRVNIGKGKSAFDKKPLGELFGNKDVTYKVLMNYRQSQRKLRLTLSTQRSKVLSIMGRL